jgi:mannose-1-phosphate guanylyltransferase / phosphomannomutase
MKAVVMAGGEGTRLRPLTSNQPKPMVPIVGRPCMEHIVELLRAHGFEDIIVTVAFMPQAIRTYFGAGEALGVSMQYSVEDSPAGTAGSVLLAADQLDDTFLVISGDALCDVDLSALVRFHQENRSSATIGLMSVENPLEFGIVVTDEEGRIERFLEKPSWGQVFSDTINTGIYVLEPEVLRHVPADRPYDFAKELFPLLLEMGRPLYGSVLDGYWQDIGNLDQYRQANFDALDERVGLNVPGIRLRGNIWLGEGVELDELERVEGPAFIGNYCRISANASVGPYTVLGSGVTLREHAAVTRSVIDAETYLGRSVLIEGAILGRSCDIRSHARIHEGAAIGDDCTLGPESVVLPGVRIYPFKEVESGTQVDRNLIWESRAASTFRGRAAMSGLVNVDLTPETALRLGMALGTALKRGSRVVASRAPQPACRLIKRALVAGISSTGVHVDDLRVMPAAVNRHVLKTLGLAAGVHVSPSGTDPEVVQIQLFEAPGIEATPELEKEVDKHFSRQEFRRASFADLGDLSFPSRAAESYVDDLLQTLDVEAIRKRAFRIVVDYSYSSASLILPIVLGALEVETIASHTYLTGRTEAAPAASLQESFGQVKRLVTAVGADFGVVIDQAGERIYLVDEQAHEVPVEQELLLLVSLISRNGRKGSIALPITATSLVEKLLDGSGLEVRRTQASLAALTSAAAEEGTVFAGAVGGGFVFPSFLPAYDAVSSLANLLELLAPVVRPLSELVADLPKSTVVHRQVRCPWALKGTVMRVLTEQMKGKETDLLDGIKITEPHGWAQVVPDANEPLVHVYAEGDTEEEANRLERELRTLVEEIIAGEVEGVPAQPEPSSGG